MSYSGKGPCTQGATVSPQSAQERALLRSDLLLKIERSGVRRVLRERIAKDLTRFRQTSRVDEGAREGDAQIVRVRRRDAPAKEVHRGFRVAKQARRFRADRVVAG